MAAAEAEGGSMDTRFIGDMDRQVQKPAKLYGDNMELGVLAGTNYSNDLSL